MAKLSQDVGPFKGTTMLSVQSDTPDTSVSTFTDDSRRCIENIAEKKLHAFKATIDPETGEYLDDPYAQNKSLSEHVAADYHGRCLIELIQNGNDAHPPERRDGEIEVLLADEGPFGTIYVANRGSPFSEKQVDALSRIGKSSKPPGESIGNKGLGFRSVSHVCDAPEIYSQSPHALGNYTFEGFCFTLEHGEALEGRLDNPRVGQLAKADLPMFSIPRWLSDQPPKVRDFSTRGFASVVRLVLRNDAARSDVLEQFRLLFNQSAPTLLFMERLCCLTAHIEAAATSSNDHILLTRTEKPLDVAPLDVSFIDLGEQGTFLLTKRSVPESDLTNAIAAGVATKQLHGSWEKWSGDGEVALAVRMDDGPVTPRLYTFLPLGEGATAPLNGYLHGSFFPTSSRTAIDASVELNRLLLEEAASLGAETVRWLSGSAATRRRECIIDTGTAARVAIDFLVWRNVTSLEGNYAGQIAIDLSATVAQKVVDSGREFADSAIVPCCDATQELMHDNESIAWLPPRKARFWTDQTDTFTVACLAKHGRSLDIAPIWPGLGKERTKRLIEFLKKYAEDEFVEQPTLPERAEIAESLAGCLPRRGKMSVALWIAFYRDLVEFMEGSSLPLAGRQIILCGDGMLRSGRSAEAIDEETRQRRRRRHRRGEKVEASIFFPPAPRQTDDGAVETDNGLKVPSPLKEYFAFASEALPWHRELKPARDFLEGSLISAYDGDTVLTRISQVMSSGATADEIVAGLRWAFAIWRHSGERLLGGKRNYPFHVPTAEGKMIPATDAVFSESWPGETSGKRLKRFLDAAPSGISDIVDLRRRSLAPTSHRAFKNRRTAQWVEFLSAIGVNRGLFAIDKKKKKNLSFKAYDLTSFAFCDEVAIPEEIADRWKNDVENFVPGGTSFDYRTYSIKGSLWWLPGQADHENFSDDCRELYSAFVVEWLEQASETVFSFQIVHEHFTSDTRNWPTPVAMFLRSEKWMPADDPQALEAVRSHFAPCDVWISSVSGERFPYYLRQPAVTLSKEIERVGDVGRKRLIKHARLRVLGERTTLLQQARFLADQFRGGTVNRHYEPQFVNLYSSTWKAIADWYATDRDALVEATVPEYLVVRRGSELMVKEPDAIEMPTICVRDNDDEVAPGLINAAGKEILEVKGADPARVGDLFAALYGDRVRLFSGLHYDVRADNVPINELPRSPTVLEVCPWLRPMVAFAIEALTGTAAGQLPTDRSSLLARLGNVGFQFVEKVDFELDGAIIPPASERRAYLFRRADATPLVVALNVGPISWKDVEDCLSPICDAIDLPQISTSMRLLARELAAADVAVGESEIDHSNLELLGRTLYLDEHTLAGAYHLLQDQVGANLPWIRAVAHLVGGVDAVDTFDRGAVGAVSDPNQLRIVLAPLLEPGKISCETVIDACRRSFKTENFREHLGFTLASFNESLIATGSEPETYPKLHEKQILQYIVDHEVEIIQALRNKVADKLERRVAAPEYVQLRNEVRLIAPNGEWLLLHKDVPNEMIANHVEAWVAEVGAPPLGQNPNGLPSLQAVRKGNRTIIANFADVAAPLVRTWCGLHDQEVPEVWTNHDVPDAKLRSTLESVGVMDFREVDDTDLLAWCVVLGIWPQGMKKILDRVTLKIETTDIEDEKAKAREEREKREARERSVEFNGCPVDPNIADWNEISDIIADKLPREIKGLALGTRASLAPVTKRTGGSGGREPSGRTDKLTKRVPSAKKEMIGRLGELVVYHWLKERFQKQDIDAAWVSKNGDEQLGRSQGSDDLGFDFRVEYRRQTWQIEVKASVGDQQRFKLGETEVRAAREASRARSNTRYVIVYVANPHDPENVHIDVLPNPMSAEADGVLDLIGEGVRFGFKRQQGYSPLLRT